MSEDCKLIEINNTCLVTEFPDVDWRNDCVIPQPQLKFPADGANDCPLIDTNRNSPTFGQSNLCLCWFEIPAGNGNPAPTSYLVQSSLDQNFLVGVNEQVLPFDTTELCYNAFETTGTIANGQTIYWRVIAGFVDADNTGCISIPSQVRSFTINCATDNLNDQLCQRYNVELNLQGPDFIKNCECCTYWVDGSWDCGDTSGKEVVRIIESNTISNVQDQPISWSVSPEIVDIDAAELGEGNKSITICPCGTETQTVNICNKIWFETNILLTDFFIEDYQNPTDSPPSEYVTFSCEACKKVTFDENTTSGDGEVISELMTTDSIKTLHPCGLPTNPNSCSALKANIQGVVHKFERKTCPQGSIDVALDNCNCRCFSREISMNFTFTPPNSTETFTTTEIGTLTTSQQTELMKFEANCEPAEDRKLLDLGSATNNDPCTVFCQLPNGNCVDFLDEETCTSTLVGGTVVDECPEENEIDCQSNPIFPQENCNVIDCSNLTQPVIAVVTDFGDATPIPNPTIVVGPNAPQNPEGIFGTYDCQPGGFVEVTITDAETDEEYTSQITYKDLVYGKRFKLYTNYSTCSQGGNLGDFIEIEIQPFAFQLGGGGGTVQYIFPDIFFSDPDKTSLISPCLTLDSCSGDDLTWTLMLCPSNSLCTSEDPFITCDNESCVSCDTKAIGPSTFAYTITAEGEMFEDIARTVTIGTQLLPQPTTTLGSNFTLFDPTCQSVAGYQLYYDEANNRINLAYSHYDQQGIIQFSTIQVATGLTCGQNATQSLNANLIVCQGQSPVPVDITVSIEIPNCTGTTFETEITSQCSPTSEFSEISNGGATLQLSLNEACSACGVDKEIILTTTQDIPLDKCFFDINRQQEVTLRKNSFYGFIFGPAEETGCYNIYTSKECACEDVFPVKIKWDGLEFFATSPGQYFITGPSKCLDCGVSEFRLGIACLSDIDSDRIGFSISEYCADSDDETCLVATANAGNLGELVEVQHLADVDQDPDCEEIQVCTPFREFTLNNCDGDVTGTIEFSNHGYIAVDAFNLLDAEVSQCGGEQVFVQLDQHTKNYVITNAKPNPDSDNSTGITSFCTRVKSVGEDGRSDIKIDRCEEGEPCPCDCDTIFPFTLCFGDESEQQITGTGLFTIEDLNPRCTSGCAADGEVTIDFQCDCNNLLMTLYEQCAPDLNEIGATVVEVSDCSDSIEFDIECEIGSPYEFTIKFASEAENCLNLCFEEGNMVWVDYDREADEYQIVNQDATCDNNLKRGHTYFGPSPSEGTVTINGESIDCSDAEGEDEDYIVFVDDCCEVQCCKKKDDCRCGPAGSTVTAAPQSEVPPNGTGQVILPDIEDPCEFTNKCDKTLQPGEQIDLFINDMCELIYDDCDPEELIFFCVCGQVFCYTPGELELGVNFTAQYCYCLNGNAPDHEVTVRLNDGSITFTVDGDTPRTTPYAGNGCGSTIIQPGSGFCYEDVRIDFGTSKECWSECISEYGSGDCTCYLTACFLGREFEFNMYSGYDQVFRNVICCPPEGSSTGSDATELSDVRLTIEYIPEQNCETARMIVKAEACGDQDEQEFEVDSRCFENQDSTLLTINEEQYGFAFSRFGLGSECGGDPDLEECCGDGDDVDIIYCCCGEEGSRSCIPATSASCSKLGGNPHPDLESCEEACMEGFCCDEETGDCSPSLSGDCESGFNIDEDACNEACGLVNCCDMSSGSCDKVLAAECEGANKMIVNDCEEDCNPNYRCDSSAGECVPDPDGDYETLDDCETACTRHRCDLSSGACVPDPSGPYLTLTECENECSNYSCDTSSGLCVQDVNGPYNSLVECELMCQERCCCFVGETSQATDPDLSGNSQNNGSTVSYTSTYGSSTVTVSNGVPSEVCTPTDTGPFTITVTYNYQPSGSNASQAGVLATVDGVVVFSQNNLPSSGSFSFEVGQVCDNLQVSVNFDDIDNNLGITSPSHSHLYAAEYETCDSANSQLGLAVISEKLTTVEETPGTELSKIFQYLGFPSCQRCKATAKKMDENGIEWCKENKNKLLKEIESNVKANRIKVGLKERTGIKTLLNIALQRAESGETVLQETQLKLAKTILQWIPPKKKPKSEDDS